MVSACAFQQILTIVKQWWLTGLQVNGQYALIDNPRWQLLQYYHMYSSKVEVQRRGAPHLHMFVYIPRPIASAEHPVLVQNIRNEA